MFSDNVLKGSARTECLNSERIFTGTSVRHTAATVARVCDGDVTVCPSGDLGDH